MTRIVVTGAAGYIGRALVEALAAKSVASASPASLVLTDRIQSNTAEPPGARWITGDIADAALQASLFAEPVDAIFHLAGVVSGAAEADYAAGKRVNLDATIALLEQCRAQVERGAAPPRLVYASSIAVFGTPLPTRIDDDTAPSPTLSYGAHKRACELLIDDCTRRAYVDGRALRLCGVVVRPPLSNGALSGFNSDLIREPLAGRDYTCPVSREATIWIASLPHVIANLTQLADVDASALGPRRALNTPALAVSVEQIVDGIARIDRAAATRIRFRPDAALEAQFGRWPLDATFARGRALGLGVDPSIDAVIRQHLESS